MTTAPALQALIDNWRGYADHGDGGAFYKGIADCAAELERTLLKQPVVPLSELRTALDCTTRPPREALEVLCFRYTPQPPNHHPQGTYLWAKEEHARGRKVGRRLLAGKASACRERGNCRLTNDPVNVEWNQCWFTDEDFTATDWEVVK
jgi:hypothetical protein